MIRNRDIVPVDDGYSQGVPGSVKGTFLGTLTASRTDYWLDLMRNSTLSEIEAELDLVASLYL